MRIERLAPEHADAYVDLFDHAFGDNPAWAGCYCQFYESPTRGSDWDPEAPGAADRNREARTAAIRAGEMQGLLAFEGDTAVGWLNAADRSRYGNLRIYAEAIEPDDQPTGSIMCFVVRPEHRGKGVATALLAATDDYFRDLGLSVAEAYPRRSPVGTDDVGWTSAFYKGSRGMFEAAGYAQHRDLDHFTVMRKPLA